MGHAWGTREVSHGHMTLYEFTDDRSVFESGLQRCERCRRVAEWSWELAWTPLRVGMLVTGGPGGYRLCGPGDTPHGFISALSSSGPVVIRSGEMRANDPIAISRAEVIEDL